MPSPNLVVEKFTPLTVNSTSSNAIQQEPQRRHRNKSRGRKSRNKSDRDTPVKTRQYKKKEKIFKTSREDIFMPCVDQLEGNSHTVVDSQSSTTPMVETSASETHSHSARSSPLSCAYLYPIDIEVGVNHNSDLVVVTGSKSSVASQSSLSFKTQLTEGGAALKLKLNDLLSKASKSTETQCGKSQYRILQHMCQSAVSFIDGIIQCHNINLESVPNSNCHSHDIQTTQFQSVVTEMIQCFNVLAANLPSENENSEKIVNQPKEDTHWYQDPIKYLHLCGLASSPDEYSSMYTAENFGHDDLASTQQHHWINGAGTYVDNKHEIYINQDDMPIGMEVVVSSSEQLNSPPVDDETDNFPVISDVYSLFSSESRLSLGRSESNVDGPTHDTIFIQSSDPSRVPSTTSSFISAPSLSEPTALNAAETHSGSSRNISDISLDVATGNSVAGAAEQCKQGSSQNLKDGSEEVNTKCVPPRSRIIADQTDSLEIISPNSVNSCDKRNSGDTPKQGTDCRKTKMKQSNKNHSTNTKKEPRAQTPGQRGCKEDTIQALLVDLKKKLAQSKIDAELKRRAEKKQHSRRSKKRGNSDDGFSSPTKKTKFHKTSGDDLAKSSSSHNDATCKDTESKLAENKENDCNGQNATKKCDVAIQAREKCNIAVQTDASIEWSASINKPRHITAEPKGGFPAASNLMINESSGSEGLDVRNGSSSCKQKQPRRNTLNLKAQVLSKSGLSDLMESGGSGDSANASDTNIRPKRTSISAPEYVSNLKQLSQGSQTRHRFKNRRSSDVTLLVNRQNKNIGQGQRTSGITSLSSIFTPEGSSSDVSELKDSSEDSVRGRPQLFPSPGRNTKNSLAAAVLSDHGDGDTEVIKRVPAAADSKNKSCFYGRRVGRLGKFKSSCDEVIGDFHKRGFQYTNECFAVIDSVYNLPESYAFRPEVSSNEDSQYHKVVKFPMCFDTITYRLRQRLYVNLNDVIKDLRRIFWNCRLYYPPDSKVLADCDKVEKCLEKKVSQTFPNMDFSDVSGSPPMRHVQQSTRRRTRQSETSPPVLSKDGKLPGELRSLFG